MTGSLWAPTLPVQFDVLPLIPTGLLSLCDVKHMLTS